MGDLTPDPEVERLARVCADADAGSPQLHPIDNDRRIAAAVLADLRERYILVPRDGAEADAQWGVRYDLVPMSAPPGRRAGEVVTFPDEREARAYVWGMAPPWQCRVVRRVTHASSWEPAP